MGVWKVSGRRKFVKLNASSPSIKRSERETFREASSGSILTRVERTEMEDYQNMESSPPVNREGRRMGCKD
jgi:hypothetical protein